MDQDSSIAATQTGIKLKGELVFASVKSFWEQSISILGDFKGATIQIDCDEITHLDSAGIALLVEWKRWCDRHQKSFLIKGIQEQGASLITTYRLQKVLLRDL